MPEQLSALTRLTFDELGHAAGGIGQIHRAIADRAFGRVGSGTPRRLHDAIAGAVYAGLRGGGRGLGGRRRGRGARPRAVGGPARGVRARGAQRPARRRARA
jgi:hypothetical protein